VDGIRIALAQVVPTVGDLEGNAAKIVAAIEGAREQGADLVAAPEMVVTGYPAEDLVLKPSFLRDNRAALEEIARAARGIVAVVGFVDFARTRDPVAGPLYNAAALLADGEVRGVYHKHLLPNYGVFDERRWFQPGESILLGRIRQIRGVTFGITICEDLWRPDGPHAACARAGAGLIVNINGSPYHRGKSRQRQDLVAAQARDHEVAFGYVNMVGGQDELVFDGASFVVGKGGRVIGRAAAFEEELLVVDLRHCAMAERPVDLAAAGEPATLVECGEGFAPRALDPADAAARTERPEITYRLAPEPASPGDAGDAGEVYGALVLGTRDYLRKNRFRQAVIGLSGGIDSSLTAAIACDAIGPEQVLGVLLPSEHTSQESISLAEELAGLLGMETVTIPIGDAFEVLLKALDPVFSGTEWGLAEENVQARIRGLLLMAISNKTGRILLSTGNKSEMATGYATLYGDMAGGFAVLKDVPKTLVWELSRWRNSMAPKGSEGPVIPPAVIDRPPTAELRSGQLDTDSLPPYEVLDPILEALVERFRSVEELVAEGYDQATVTRVAELVDRAEYKRRQAAPGIKITDRAFGRDRRLPITNRYRPKGGG
jgi:NAD+ synthase (glutamine-hydrolysing)